MEHLSERLKSTSDMFLAQVREAFGENLVTVVLYGAAARGESPAGKKIPYINYLVVIQDNSPSELARCARFMNTWRKHLIVTPLFLRNGFISRSLDTFPLEFMDMQAAYHVLYGEDVLADIVFSRRHVRSQCERELKGKLLHLRAEYLTLRKDKKGLMDLAYRSLATFRLVFAGALYLKEIDIPKETGALLGALNMTFELDDLLFKRLRAVAGGEVTVSEREADKLFDLYVEELDKLSLAIDAMAPEL